MRVLTVIGTRPEVIKMAPVLNALRTHAPQVVSQVCSSGQHKEMLDDMLAAFDIRPAFSLGDLSDNASLSQLAARVLEGLDPILAHSRPDWLVVQGDTATVMAASLAAGNRKVKVAHVEAGLRSHDRANPFPEELYRVVADHASQLHFAPTQRAKENLLREGITGSGIFVTGNTVVDALAEALKRPALDWPLPDLAGRRLILVTAHRRENHGRPLAQICAALAELVRRPDVHIAYCVHHNPEVWGPVQAALGGIAHLSLLAPQPYATMVQLMRASALILTDSGGIQEEAPFLGVPVLVLREVTERPEAVEAGAARLVGANRPAIVAAAARLLDDPAAYRAMARAVSPYGDGRAGTRIAAILANDGRLPAGVAEYAPAPTDAKVGV